MRTSRSGIHLCSFGMSGSLSSQGEMVLVAKKKKKSQDPTPEYA
jgi:hypothetical protein